MGVPWATERKRIALKLVEEGCLRRSQRSSSPPGKSLKLKRYHVFLVQKPHILI